MARIVNGSPIINPDALPWLAFRFDGGRLQAVLPSGRVLETMPVNLEWSVEEMIYEAVVPLLRGAIVADAERRFGAGDAIQQPVRDLLTSLRTEQHG